MVIGNYQELKSDLKICILFRRARTRARGGENKLEIFNRNEIKKERYQIGKSGIRRGKRYKKKTIIKE